MERLPPSVRLPALIKVATAARELSTIRKSVTLGVSALNTIPRIAGRRPTDRLRHINDGCAHSLGTGLAAEPNAADGNGGRWTPRWG
jgi:hypothetical protein